MKTADTVFLNRLLKTEGEAPRILVEIQCGYPNESTTLYCSTERLEIGDYDFREYVLEFGSLTSSIGEQDFIASPNTFSFTVVRNVDTEKLLGTYQKVRFVFVKQWFKSLSTYAQALDLGTFIIDSINNITQSSFSINCVSNEKELDKEVPTDTLSQFWYPDMDNENVGIQFPVCFGSIKWEEVDITKHLYSYFGTGDVAPAYCIDPANYYYLVHRSVYDAEGIVQPYRYIEEHDLLAKIINYTAFHDPNPQGDKQWQIQMGIPSSTNPSNVREVKIFPDRIDPSNTSTNPMRACDLDSETYAQISMSNQYFRVLLNNLSGIADYKSGNNWYRASIVCEVDSPAQSTYTLSVSILGGEEKHHQYVSTGRQVIEMAEYVTATGALNPTLSQCYIRITLNSGGPLKIRTVLAKITYWENMGSVIYRRVQPKFPRFYQRGKEPEYQRNIVSKDIISKVDPDIKVNEVYSEMNGMKDSSGYSWLYYHPVSVLLSMLKSLAEIVYLQADIAQWNSIYASMGTAWSVGFAFWDKANFKETISNLLRESNLAMFVSTGGYGKLKLFKINKAKTTPDMIFTDNEADIYLMKNFRWEWTETFYNKFDLKYHWDNLENEYRQNRLYSKSNPDNPGNFASILETSFQRYNFTEVDYPYSEFKFIRSTAVMDKWVDEAIKYWKQLKVWVEFETSLVGCLLELGDTIQIDHSAQNWAQEDKSFQVVELEQMGNSVRIKAIEVIP